MQVAGTMLGAVCAGTWTWAVFTQPSSVRALPLRCSRADDTPQIASIVPVYACPVADTQLEGVQSWTEHRSENVWLKARLDAMFGTAGLDVWASWCM